MAEKLCELKKKGSSGGGSFYVASIFSQTSAGVIDNEGHSGIVSNNTTVTIGKMTVTLSTSEYYLSASASVAGTYYNYNNPNGIHKNANETISLTRIWDSMYPNIFIAD